MYVYMIHNIIYILQRYIRFVTVPTGISVKTYLRFPPLNNTYTPSVNSLTALIIYMASVPFLPAPTARL